jgi:hypothetical protein
VAAPPPAPPLTPTTTTVTMSVTRALPPPPVQKAPELAEASFLMAGRPCFLPPPHAPGVANRSHESAVTTRVPPPATPPGVLLPPFFAPMVTPSGESLPPPPAHSPTFAAPVGGIVVAEGAALPSPSLSTTQVARPSTGSELHASGLCTPCAWFWKPQGCMHGESCLRCHLCPQGEVKTRKIAKKAHLRQEAANRADQEVAPPAVLA